MQVAMRQGPLGAVAMRHPGVRRVRPTCASSSQGASAATSTSAAPAAAQQQLRVWLNSKELERSVKLEVLAEGTGQVIVVSEVDPDSSAAEEGLEVGQKLLAISDPVRDSEVWDLGDRPSLRFVRDTLRMRRMGQVQLVLSDVVPAYVARLAPPPTSSAAAAAAAPAASSTATEAQGGSPGPAADQNDVEDGSGLRAVSTLDSLLSGSESEGEGTRASPGATMTLGERMAAEFAAKQQAQQQVSEVGKRIARRAAYMDEVSQRNDTPLAAGLAVAFLGPALIILAVAAGTGYLDRLYDASLTLR